MKSWIASLTRWLDGRGWAEPPVIELTHRYTPPAAPVVDLPADPVPASTATRLIGDRRRIADTFDAARPVRTRGELFGRAVELDHLLAATLDFHQHAVIHGARGSGKTSLVRVLGEHADESGASCSISRANRMRPSPTSSGSISTRSRPQPSRPADSVPLRRSSNRCRRISAHGRSSIWWQTASPRRRS
ncbi:ATP-binding protein [Sphingomonas sp. Ant20]|uniref:ATP-binding protein n=1 Tax=Sphingomonas sp. Ant20 TaxID=104605 RepID=UPI0018E2E0DF|nr:ATP-binding protein [Sphingomonas sp. Ant20]